MRSRQRKRFSNSVGTSRNGYRVKQKLLNADIACGKNSYLHLFNGCYTKRTGKNVCPFSIGTIPQKYGGIVPNIVPHIVPNIVPIELQKPLFYAAVGKEKILSTHKTILALLTNRLSYHAYLHVSPL